MNENELKHDPEILAQLQRKTFYHVDFLPARDGHWVVFEDKGKLKMGIIRDRYHSRYGVDVRAVLKKDARYPWVQSKDLLTNEQFVRALDMMADGSYTTLPVFDVTTLSLIRD